MVKKTVLLLIIVMVLLMPISFAEIYVVDQANLFNDVSAIEVKLVELEERLGYPSYIVTSDQPYDTDPLSAADLLLADRVGFDNNGIMLAININSRDITLTTSGPDLQENSISESQIIGLREAIGKKMSTGDYDAAAALYYQKLRRILGGNFLSFFDMVIAALASLFGVGGYGLAQFARYKPKTKNYVFPLHENAIANLERGEDLLINTREIIHVIPKEKPPSGGGSTSHTTGGGSFRGSTGKF